MKKLIKLTAAFTVLGMVACTPSKPGYVITGTAEGASDGDTIILQEVSGRQRTNIDTAVIANGTFTFKGVQDSVANGYVVYPKGELLMDFFLENGKITLALTKNNDSATGTPTNDAYQEVRSKLNALDQKAQAIYAQLGDESATDEQKEAQKKELVQLQNEMDQTAKASIEKNISNPVGLMLFKQNFYGLETEEANDIINKLPAAYQNDEMIVRFKEVIDKRMQTAVGQKFTDFEMLTPDGKPVKLSDYVGKGKVVLIDFWASWCGPCRREMPNLVDAYKQYKGKKFEIVGVSLDQDGEAWKTAIQKMDMTWPQMSDLKYWNSEGAKIYGVNSIPHTVLIDGEGTIIARGLHGEEVTGKLAEILK